MKTAKRILSLALALVLCLSIGLYAAPGAQAAYDTANADYLKSLGLFNGTDKGYELERAASRVEAAVMLIRLMGQEERAKAQYAGQGAVCPFSDVPGWAAPQLAWLYENSLVNGVSATAYGSTNTVTAQQFSALILRSLGYSEANGSFTYAGALDFAAKVGLFPAADKARLSSAFYRGDIVDMCCKALKLKCRDSDRTLYQKLDYSGVFSGNGSAAVSGKKVSLSMKYQGGGSADKWYVEPLSACSPVITDLDGDGKLEAVYSGLSLFCLDAATGKTKWSVKTGTDRAADQSSAAAFGYTNANLFVQDIDGDGAKEIVVAHCNGNTATGCLSVYDCNGYFKAGFPVKTPAPINALTVTDLEKDGWCEICVGLGTGDTSKTLYIYEPDGSVRPGWPQQCGNSLYSNSIEPVDLNGDGLLELVCLNDTEHLWAFNSDGSRVTATGGIYSGLKWNGVPLCPENAFEERCAKWAQDPRFGGEAWATDEHVLGSTKEYRDCFMGTIGGIDSADMDGDGKTELVVTGLIADGSLVMRDDPDSFSGNARYFTAFVLNTDRTRYVNSAKGFDWTNVPTDNGTPLLMDPYRLNYAYGRPALCDLDGDGNREIVFSACDGKVHCFSLDGTEHGAWPFSLTGRSSSVAQYASAPVCADVNGDGRSEVIFTTYTDTTQLHQRGSVYVLGAGGEILGSAVIPTKWGDGDYAPNGAQASPTVADIDGDGGQELVITSLYSGLMVYDVN